jgi:hypothetical protein
MHMQRCMHVHRQGLCVDIAACKMCCAVLKAHTGHVLSSAQCHKRLAVPHIAAGSFLTSRKFIASWLKLLAGTKSERAPDCCLLVSRFSTCSCMDKGKRVLMTRC